MKRFVVAIALTLAVSPQAFAADDESADREYRAVLREVRRDIHPGTAAQVVPAAHRLAVRIASTQVGEDLQEKLRSELMFAAVQAIEDDSAHIRFLRSGDAELQKVAAEDLMSWRTLDADMKSALVALAGDPKAANEARIAAAWALRTSKQPELEAVVNHAALDHGNASLAHTLSAILVSAWDDDRGRVNSAIDSPVRAIREEAAMMVRWNEPRAADAVPILIGVMKDRSEPDEARGSAIMNLGNIDDPRAHAALAGMLDPHEWFCCTGGSHPVHGLGLVIDGIRQHPLESDQQAFEGLRRRLKDIPADEREFVAWRLDVATGVLEK